MGQWGNDFIDGGDGRDNINGGAGAETCIAGEVVNLCGAAVATPHFEFETEVQSSGPSKIMQR